MSKDLRLIPNLLMLRGIKEGKAQYAKNGIPKNGDIICILQNSSCFDDPVVLKEAIHVSGGNNAVQCKGFIESEPLGF